ncbi:MAG TPA: ABC transporter permease [Thermotogota bacterium]|nr:ABC transporter permease [Thermotogota bacterium]HRW92516.1 ABC transporter permease [Thermotogota bacterium]
MMFYIVRRVLFGLLTLWVVMTITFFLMHAIPGGPFDMDSMDVQSPSYRRIMEERFGLNKSIFEQYLMYLGNLARGELGLSISYYPRTVNQIIAQGFPVSARLGGIAILLSIVAGIVWGVVAGLRQGRWQDNLMKVLTALGITIPGFVLATLLIYSFAVELRWLPPMGLRSWKHYILPAVALSFGPVAYLARLTRSSLLDVIRQDYMKTARAKGLSRRKVIYKHALKNSMLPIVTYIAPLIAGLMTGSFVIEKVFAIPGMGREMVLAIGNRDYMMILGLTFFFSALIVFTYIITDVLYAFLDPRIKLGK